MSTITYTRTAQELFDESVVFAPESLIEWIMRDSDETREMSFQKLEDVKRFLCLCASNPGARLAVSKLLDETWHSFVLHTQLYSRFCNEFLGTFIHHRPTSQPESEAYARTLELYASEFGTPDARWWPKNTKDAGDCDSGTCQGYCSCATCDTSSN